MLMTKWTDFLKSYAKKNNINYEIVEPNIKKKVKKSYADNFTK